MPTKPFLVSMLALAFAFGCSESNRKFQPDAEGGAAGSSNQQGDAGEGSQSETGGNGHVETGGAAGVTLLATGGTDSGHTGGSATEPGEGESGAAGLPASGAPGTGGTGTGGDAGSGSSTGGAGIGGTASGGGAAGKSGEGGEPSATGGTATGGVAGASGDAGARAAAECTSGETRACGTAEELGQCHRGSQECVDGFWNECVIESVPDAEELSCDDGNALTKNEVCAAGACVGTEDPVLARRAIAVGLFHTCAIRAGGTVYCWGRNDTGQLGNEDATIDDHGPVQVTGVTDAVAIDAGNRHTCALTSAGALMCWGDNLDGPLGHGDTTTVSVGTVEGLTATDFGAGNYGTCAIDEAGDTWCWGANGAGQLGVSSETLASSAVPYAVASAPTLLAISVGVTTVCGLTSPDRVLVCWGSQYDEAGTTTVDPVTINAMSGTTVLAPGGLHGCVRRDSGIVACWGSNDYGELGTGAVGTFVDAPSDISGLIATQVSACDYGWGGGYTCARLMSGQVACWGSNDVGQFGNGDLTVTQSITPVVVPDRSDFITVVAGSGVTCARTLAGDVYCWGGSSGFPSTYGMINGDPAVLSSAVPLLVELP